MILMMMIMMPPAAPDDTCEYRSRQQVGGFFQAIIPVKQDSPPGNIKKSSSHLQENLRHLLLLTMFSETIFVRYCSERKAPYEQATRVVRLLPDSPARTGT